MSNDTEQLTRINFSISRELKAKLQTRALALGVSTGNLICMLVAEQMEQKEMQHEALQGVSANVANMLKEMVESGQIDINS